MDDINIGEWRCQDCTLENESNVLSCAACDALAPNLAQAFDDNPLDLEDQVRFNELLKISMDPLVLNVEKFDCLICLSSVEVGKGVILKECLHSFCRVCIEQHVVNSEDVDIKCPFADKDYSCGALLLEGEIKALISEDDFQRYLSRGLKQAEAQMKNSIHCKKTDCPGWIILGEDTDRFTCPVCNHENCVSCSAIHDGLDCYAYKMTLPDNATNASLSHIQDMVLRGSAMSCPTCGVVVLKIDGCAWLQCTLCKTELCWMTKGYRWGPNGKADNTGGCRCRLNNVLCHPMCNNCH